MCHLDVLSHKWLLMHPGMTEEEAFLHLVSRCQSNQSVEIEEETLEGGGGHVRLLVSEARHLIQDRAQRGMNPKR